MKILKRLFLTGAGLSFLLVGAVAQAASSAEIVHNALNDSARMSEDAADDARRMPLEVLAFAGIEEGMIILEMEAGGGYYTEIMSRAVGSNGRVIRQNPPAINSFFSEEADARLANNRLTNVDSSLVNFDDLEAEDNSIDMVTWILGPHELWFSPGGENLGDPEDTFVEIARVLKPGGVFLTIDHNAASDSDTDIGGSLHRIYEGHIVDLAEGAGLTLLRSSNLHSNENDPLDIGVFDPAIQGRTDKFVLLYQK